MALEVFSCLRGGSVWKMVAFDGGVGGTWYYGHSGAFHVGSCSARGASWALRVRCVNNICEIYLCSKEFRNEINID